MSWELIQLSTKPDQSRVDNSEQETSGITEMSEKSGFELCAIANRDSNNYQLTKVSFL